MKKILRKFLPKKIRDDIKANLKYYKTISHHLFRRQRFKILSDRVNRIQIISQKNKHVFCGYFDIAPNSQFDSDRILAHVLPLNAVPGETEIELSFYDLELSRFISFYTTKAWCWQQGSRLRWGKDKNIVFFNDIDENQGYCCRKFNVKNRRIEQTINFPLYDISRDEKYGISINFERLQKLRPGYGYMCYDKFDKTNAPNDDGIFYIDLVTGENKLLVSLYDLSSMVKESEAGKNYINHISISPKGQYVMFFHLWTVNQMPGWKATLCVYNIRNNKVLRLEDVDQVSHYTWKDEHTILITGVDACTKKGFYRLYNIVTQNKYDINNILLQKDGHPTFSRKFNGFYGDTYPSHSFIQSFFSYDCSNNHYEKIIDLFSDPRLYDDKRCDLHPHYFRSCETIALDSTFEKKQREIILINMKENTNE